MLFKGFHLLRFCKVFIFYVNCIVKYSEKINFDTEQKAYSKKEQAFYCISGLSSIMNCFKQCENHKRPEIPNVLTFSKVKCSEYIEWLTIKLFVFFLVISVNKNSE